jgi:hypothetical protein
MLGLKYGILLIGMMASVLSAVLTADEGTDFFEKKIRPVLVEHCYKCHSAKHDSSEGGLRVDHREAMRDGGDSGSAIVPENIEESLLIAAILYNDDFYQMPPDNKLPDRVIADFKKWIEMGAPDPRDPPEDELASDSPDTTSARETLWSLAPLRQTPPWEHRGF